MEPIAVTGTHFAWGIFASLGIAILGAYTALDLSERAAGRIGRARHIWYSGAGIAVGTAIWTMHFVGMLSLRLPVPVAHGIGHTVLSWILAVAVSGAAFFVWERGGSTLRLVVAGTLLGLGIVVMHYVGMAGMQFAGSLRFSPFSVVSATILGVAGGIATLWLIRREFSSGLALAGAIVLGLGVASMHYTGMAGTEFVLMTDQDYSAGHGDLIHDHDLVIGIGAGVALLLITGLFGAQFDRRRALAAMAAGQIRTSEILESISDAFYAVDRNWRFTYINRKCAEWWGRERDRLIGKVYWEEFPLAVGSRPYDAHMRAMTERRPISLEAVSPILGHWVDIAIYPSSDGGLSVYFRDISQRKKDEAALGQAKEEAERAALAKSQFLAAASHDLRQPFQAMRLFKEVLTPHVSEPGLVALRGLENAMASGEELLHSLLDISSLEAGAVRVNLATVFVPELLQELCGTYADVSASRGLKFKCRPVAAHLETDPVLLRRLIRNLIENAVRFTERGGILLACRMRAGGLSFEVWDTGPGIPEDRLDDIFQEFVQLDNAERDRTRGLGLGLAIVQKGAALLGARVEVKSRVGKGSMFAIVFPPHSNVSSPSSSADGGSASVLSPAGWRSS